MRMSKGPRRTATAFFWVNFTEAVKSGGCPVCAMLQRSTRRYLESFLYENVSKGDLRARLVASQGFCNAHGHALVDVARTTGDVVGAAILYEHLTWEVGGQVSQALAALSSVPTKARLRFRRKALGQSVSDHLTADEACPLCGYAAHWAELMVRQFVQQLSDSQEAPEMRRVYAQSDGLCLPHLRQALWQAKDGEAMRFLLQTQQEKLNQVHRELSEFCRKQDYRFRDLPMTEKEKSSWARAVELLVGKRDRSPLVS